MEGAGADHLSKIREERLAKELMTSYEILHVSMQSVHNNDKWG